MVALIPDTSDIVKRSGETTLTVKQTENRHRKRLENRQCHSGGLGLKPTAAFIYCSHDTHISVFVNIYTTDICQTRRLKVGQLIQQWKVQQKYMNLKKCHIYFSKLGLTSLPPHTRLDTIYLSSHYCHAASDFGSYLKVRKSFSSLQMCEHMVGVMVGIICVILFGHIQFGSQSPVETAESG